MTPENEVFRENEKVLYTDGRDVTVTPSTLKVKHTSYKLNGITKHSMRIRKAERWPGVLLLLIGAALAVCGFMNLIPTNMVDNIQVEDASLNPNTLAMWIGGFLALIGILIMGLVKEKYAVHIGTAEGEKDALVSPKREYIDQVIEALNQATRYRPSSGTAFYTTVR